MSKNRTEIIGNTFDTLEFDLKITYADKDDTASYTTTQLWLSTRFDNDEVREDTVSITAAITVH